MVMVFEDERTVLFILDLFEVKWGERMTEVGGS